MDSNQDFAWHIHSYINEYIRLADAKALGLIAAAGTLTAVLAARASSNLAGAEAFLFATAIFSLTAVILLAGWVVFPRLGGEGPGIIFWRQVRSVDQSTYQHLIQTRTPDELLFELTNHIHQLSGIATSKYWALRSAFGAAAVAFPLAALTLYLI